MSEEIGGDPGTQESISPAPSETAPVPTEQDPPQPEGAGTEADPTAQQNPAMVPSWRLRQIREQMTQQFQGQMQQTLQQQQTQWQQQQQQALAAQKAEHDAKVRAFMGLEQPADPAMEEARKKLFQIVPGLEEKLGQQQTPPIEQHPAFQGIAERLNAWERVQEQGQVRFGMERRTELQRIAKESLGRDLTGEQQQLLGMQLAGLLQTNRKAQTAFLNDPNFIGDFWKLHNKHFGVPAAKAAAASKKQQATQGTGPQSKPGGSGVPVTKPNELGVDEKLKRHFERIQKKA